MTKTCLPIEASLYGYMGAPVYTPMELRFSDPRGVSLRTDTALYKRGRERITQVRRASSATDDLPPPTASNDWTSALQPPGDSEVADVLPSQHPQERTA